MSVQRNRGDDIDWAFDSLDDPNTVTLYAVEQGDTLGSQTEWITADVADAVELEDAQ